MVDIHLTAFSAETRKRALAQMISELGITSANLIRDDYHKPFLQSPEGQIFGLAITHIRNAAKPFSLMAASTCPQLGLDAELWNQAPRDDVFLNSVMAKEEAKLAATLKAMGHDAGLFLWVGKEAALKAHGNVMVDPRHLVLRQKSGNHFRAEPSNSAMAPIMPASLWFYTLMTPESEATLLLAIGLVNVLETTQTITMRAEKRVGLRPFNLD